MRLRPNIFSGRVRRCKLGSLTLNLRRNLDHLEAVLSGCRDYMGLDKGYKGLLGDFTG